MTDKTRVLVTGGSGFLGRAIVEELKAFAQHDVFCLNGRHSSVPATVSGRYFCGDIARYESLENLESIEKIDAVIHCAGLAHQFGKVRREDFRRVNVEGTKNVCRLAQKLGARKFILISSVAVYGDHGDSIVDETFECRPQGFYAESKLESEKETIEYSRKSGSKLVILRPATIIGEDDRGNTQRLIKAIDRGFFIPIGRGLNKKSLIYKNDVARAVKLALDDVAQKSFEIFNLSAEAVEMRSVIGEICRNLGKSEPRLTIGEKAFQMVFAINNRTISSGTLRKLENTFRKWISDDIYAGEKFAKVFGFQNEVSISEALARQVRYYRTQKN